MNAPVWNTHHVDTPVVSEEPRSRLRRPPSLGRLVFVGVTSFVMGFAGGAAAYWLFHREENLS